jgi:ferredoxin-NADP reductase
MVAIISSALPDPSPQAASPSGRVKGRRKPGEASPLTRLAGMRQASSPLVLLFLLFLFSCAQSVVPVFGRRGQAQPVATSLIGDAPQSAGKGLALTVGIGRGNNLGARTRGKPMHRGFCILGPPPAGAEIQTALPQTFKRSKTHGINRGFGDAETERIDTSRQYLTLRFDEAGLRGAKRNYSISSGPSADFYRITVKREPQGEASVFLHDHAKLGTVIECIPPAGDFFLSDNPERPVILLSGGVGLTPMVSMMETIAARHPDVSTYYAHGTTSRSTHALDAEVRELALRHGTTNVTTFYDTVDEASSEHCGFITIDWLAANTPLADADVYVCGPQPFLPFFVRGLVSAGVPSDRVHYEFFGPTDEALVA